MWTYNRVVVGLAILAVGLIVVGIVIGRPSVGIEGAHFNRSVGAPALAGTFSPTGPGLVDPSDGNLWVGAGLVALLVGGAALVLRGRIRKDESVARAATRAADKIASSEWQVDVLAQADRLESQLERVSNGDSATTRRIQVRLEQAQRIATGQVTVGPLRDWLAGLSVETAWRCLQEAQEELLLVRPKAELQAEVPYWRRLAASLPADQDRDIRLSAWESGDPDQIDPLVGRSILEAAHVKTNTAHMAVRRLRNRVLALAVMIASVVIALWIGDVTAGAIVGIGALGGLVSVVFIAKGSDVAAAYNVQGSQALLKVAAGAGTAILAVAILKGTGGSTDTAHVYAYASDLRVLPASIHQARGRQSTGRDERRSGPRSRHLTRDRDDTDLRHWDIVHRTRPSRLERSACRHRSRPV